MLVLVMNSGSSSLKFQLINMKTNEVLSKGLVERIGGEGKAAYEIKAKDQKLKKEADVPDHKEAVRIVTDALVNGDLAVIDDLKEVDAIGHRVVQGGETVREARVVNEELKELIRRYTPMAPLHNPAALLGIEACETNMPGIPQVGVFDTAYHQTMDAAHYMYAIPYEDYETYEVRRYGAHGTSHKYVAQEIIKKLGKDDLKIITCHLGNGASISAIKDGKIMDTSMGFTPLEGLVMGTRSGNIDPAAVLYLKEKLNLDDQGMDDYLNKKSGLLGVSGISNDFRDIERAMDEGNKRAQLAYDLFVLRVKQYIGSYFAELNGCDVLVFTAGIGENDDRVRRDVCLNMEALGIEVDEAQNEGCREERLISTEKSAVQVYVLPTNEERAIAQETIEALSK